MHWILADKIPQSIAKQFASYHPAVAQSLWNRGIKTKEQAESYFTQDLTKLLPPDDLGQISKAVEIILEHIKQGTKIAIYGDYDVDGVCATSIMFDYLYRKLGAEVVPYIPNRFDEGYGLNSNAVEDLIDQGVTLIITVDCGIRDEELLAGFNDANVEFVITDHHTIPEEGPPVSAAAVVHPSYPDTDYPFSELCGAAVAYKLVQALHQVASDLEISALADDEYLDLVALATVCDVMPLSSENRQLVSLGLKRMQSNPTNGLMHLFGVAGVEHSEAQAYHLGFTIGPRINAGGRIAHALDGVRLFTTKNSQAARSLATRLDELNRERQELTKQMLTEAKAQVPDDISGLVFVHGDGWSEGVVGLVAGKLCEQLYRPVLAATVHGDTVTGSARSIPGIHITDIIGKSKDLLTRYGGHAQAAGFSLPVSNLEEFKQAVTKAASAELTDELTTKTLKIDALVSPQELSFDLHDALDSMQPFGMGNSKPLFQLDGLALESVRQIGKDNHHLKAIVSTDKGTIELLGFGMGGRYEDLSKCATIDVVGSLAVNEWKGSKTLQIHLKDFRNAEEN